MDIKGFLRHVCWQPQPSILSPAVHECIHAAKNSVEHLDPTLWKYTAVLGYCPESFPQVPQKVHQPQISITHLVFVGSIPTVRDPVPGEQYL